MEAQKDVENDIERREGECQGKGLPDLLASNLATVYLRRQHDPVGRGGFLIRWTWVFIPALLCTNCVTLGKYLKFCHLRFSPITTW
jgi:hypothetical protein